MKKPLYTNTYPNMTNRLQQKRLELLLEKKTGPEYERLRALILALNRDGYTIGSIQHRVMFTSKDGTFKLSRRQVNQIIQDEKPE